MSIIRARLAAYERPSCRVGRSMRLAALMLIAMMLVTIGVALVSSVPPVSAGAGSAAIESPPQAGHLISRDVVRVTVASKKDDAYAPGHRDLPATRREFDDLPHRSFRHVGVRAPRAPPATPSRLSNAYRPRAPPSVIA